MNLIATSTNTSRNKDSNDDADKNHHSSSYHESFKSMNQNFTLLSQQRRNFDITLTMIRSEFARMEGAIQNLTKVSSIVNAANSSESSTSTMKNKNSSSLSSLQDAVTILSAEVDCHRRTLDALSRLHDEKQILLERQRQEHDRDVRKLKQNILFVYDDNDDDNDDTANPETGIRKTRRDALGDADELVEELRQTEQRIRDLEDTILAETDLEDFSSNHSLSFEDKTKRQEEIEKEKYLKLMISNTEKELVRLDARLRQVSMEEGDELFEDDDNKMMQNQKKKMASSLQQENMNPNNNNNKLTNRTNTLLLKKGALQSKLNQRKMIVNRLTAAVEQIPKHLRNNSNNNQQHQNKFNINNNNDHDSLSASLRSYQDAHRLISLVKSSVCHLQENFEEISSLITKYTLERNLILQKIQKQQQQEQKNKKKGKNKTHQTVLDDDDDDDQQQQPSLEMWTQDELYKVLEDIQRQSALVLERHMMMDDDEEDTDEDDDDEDESDTENDKQSTITTMSGNQRHNRTHSSSSSLNTTSTASPMLLLSGIDDLLKCIRKLTVLIDVMEPALGKRSVFQQLQFADNEFNLLPQLLQITQTALEIKSEIVSTRKNHHHNNTSSIPDDHHQRTTTTSTSVGNVRTPSGGVKNFASPRVGGGNTSPATRLF